MFQSSRRVAVSVREICWKCFQGIQFTNRLRLNAAEFLQRTEETIRLLAQGKTFEEIAAIRGRQLASVISLVADLIEQGRLEFQAAWIDTNKRNQIEAACAKLGIERLHAIKAALPEQITYEEIRLVVAQIRC